MITTEEQLIINRLEKFFYEKSSNVEMLVKIIELAGDYLNASTISNYAKQTGKSYNGVKNFAPTTELFGVKFVIDNR